MAAAARAIAEQLSAQDGLPYRFWLAENMLGQGRVEEAGLLYDDLRGQANELGLFPDRIGLADGSFPSRFPDPASHVAVIAGGLALAQGRSGR